MSSDALNLIKKAMDEMELKYGFMEYVPDSGETLPATYFIGEYQELEPEGESGEETSIFILTGFSRETWGALECVKERIRKYFPAIDGRRRKTEAGAVVAVFYENSFPVLVEDEELKRMQINLKGEEWKVET